MKLKDGGRFLLFREDKYQDSDLKVLIWGAKSGERDKEVGTILGRKLRGKGGTPQRGLRFVVNEKTDLEMPP